MIGYVPNTLKEYISFRNQDRFGVSHRVAVGPHQDEGLDEGQRELDFSQSLEVPRPRANSNTSTTSSFLTSVQVVPTSGGKYNIYPANRDNQTWGNHGNSVDVGSRSLLVSRSYGHNISNPDFSRQHGDSEVDLRREVYHRHTRNSQTNDKDRHGSVKESRPPSRQSVMRKIASEPSCSCRSYHTHIFNEDPKMAFPKTQAVETSALTQLPEVKVANDNHLTICNTFWKVNLVCCDYKHQDRTVDFKSLWPGTATIKDFLNDGVQDTGLRSAIWELCLLSIASGPLTVLKALLDLSLIRVDYQFENDVGLLHLACLLQNSEAIQLLTQTGISPKMKDKNGRIASQVCYCPRIRRQLPAKYQSGNDRSKVQTLLKPGLQDKDAVFKLAANPKHFYEVQNKLQVFGFNVNKEINSDGDYLIHVACRAGLSQLPLLMSLVRLQSANIELCNLEGMSPLMIVAQEGETNLCDIFMCFFGADPNTRNVMTGKTALHYAVLGNSVSTVNCLIKRGGDVSIEDNDGCLPDDLPIATSSIEDCREVIQVHRAQRCQQLVEMITEDTIYPIDLRASDLPVVDSEGYTLVMLAAQHDRVHNLETLLAVSTSTINAQHWKTGMTALGLAAAAGNALCVRSLLRAGANPTVGDITGLLPIHHAVVSNHEKAVEIFFEFFPVAYVGLYKCLKMCKRSSIHDKVHSAWERRQHEIVSPQLRVCAMDGKAEELFCLLEEGDNVNYRSDLSNLSPLFLAIDNGHIDVIKLLKEKGANLRERDQLTGSTVLHVVAKTGHLEMAKFLLQFCQHTPGPSSGRSSALLDVNAVNNDKKTALQIAADKGYIKLVNLLINHGATTALLNPQGALFTSADFEGVRVLIETHRAEHTKQIMKCVAEKSRKSFMMLSKIWVPRFDHNLRDKNGNTPLMVACRKGHVEVIRFLVESAVYAAHTSSDEENLDNNSDTDSGVLDLPPWRSRAGSFNEEMLRSLEKSQDFQETVPTTSNMDFSRSLNPMDARNNLVCKRDVANRTQHIHTLLQDVERPKGLYIYHDGIVSHVCAVNLFDGCTPLHRAIEGGDNPVITAMLVEADRAAINMQNDAGLTAVHLACVLGRKKVLAHLLSVDEVDINLFTLNGHLPEELTSNKTLIRMVQKARKGQPVRPATPKPEVVPDWPASPGSVPSVYTGQSDSSWGNFTAIYDRYERMKEEQSGKLKEKPSTSQQQKDQ